MCVEACPALLASSPSPYDALTRWIDLFLDLLGTKHGLAGAMQSDDDRSSALHSAFVDRLVPACAALLDAAADAGQVRADVDAYELLRGVGNLSIGAENPRYDARRMVNLLLTGLRT